MKHDTQQCIRQSLPVRVQVQEVSLRDGIQNERKIVSTEDKIRLVQRFVACGIKRIEVSSFVNPKLIPQMADAEELWERIERRKDVAYSALILSEKGMDRAIRCRVSHVGLFVSASETHSMKNSNKTVADAMKEALHLIEKARNAGMNVRAGVMNAFGCAFDGTVPAQKVLKHVQAFLTRSPHEIALADTTGMGNPRQVADLLRKVKDITGDVPLSLHVHNTRGLGLANVWAALNEGVSIFDASLGGLGGCPFIPGARGNIATEDLVHLLHETGIRTGIDLPQLIEASLGFEKVLGQVFPATISHLGQGGCDLP